MDKKGHLDDKKPDFSLILPCYNESQHIDESIAAIVAALSSHNYSHEIILIDDKSHDNTVEHIKNLAKKYKEVRCSFHEKNTGRGGTVRDGILMSKADIVGYIDIDIEVSPQYIPSFVEAVKNGADIVVGRRLYPILLSSFDSLLRSVLSKSYSLLVKILLNLPIRDTEAGYKFFNRSRIMPVLLETRDTHWFWDTEIVSRGVLNDLVVKEIPVAYSRKEEKKSSLRLLPDTIAYLKSIIRFRREYKKLKGEKIKPSV